jgi:quercetin dioxygenase-like cupin family protein
MPVFRSADEPTFDLQGHLVAGLATPSLGARETIMYRLRVNPDSASLPAHRHDHEEVFHVLSGSITWIGDGEEHPVHAGDTVIIPAGVLHSASATGEPADLLAAMPVGTLFIPEEGEGAVPPWGK